MPRYEAYPTPRGFVGSGSRGGGSVADLIMERGRGQADAELRGAAGWQDAIGNITGALSGAATDFAKRRGDEQVQKAVTAATAPGTPDVNAILGNIADPAVRERARKGIQDLQMTRGKFQEQNLQIEELQGKLKDAETKRQQVTADHWGTIGLNLEQHFADPDGGITAANYAVGFSKDMPGADRLAPFAQQAAEALKEAQASGDPAHVEAVKKAWMEQVRPLIEQGKAGMSSDARKAWTDAVNAARPPVEKIETKNPDGSSRISLVEEKPGQTFESAAEPEKPGSEADFIRREYGLNPTPQQILAGRERYSAAGREPDVAMSLTPAALRQAAQLFLDTGQMPPAGMGKQGTAMRQAILNEAAKMSPDANVAENKITFAADKASLGKLQQQTDAVAAFESTASKNAKLLEETLGKIPDAGTKILNRPLRDLAGVAGSEDIAAFNTIRQSVQNEYARIISNPTLAGQMSDSARKEGEAILSGDLTVGQLRAAIRVLQAEAKNRHTSYDEQIKAIKGRRHGGAAEAPKDPLGLR